MIHKIVAVGKLREKHWQDAVSDYARRLRPYARVEMMEIAEARIPERASPAKERVALDQEASAILERLKIIGPCHHPGQAGNCPGLRAALRLAAGPSLRGRKRDCLGDRRPTGPGCIRTGKGGSCSILLQINLPSPDDAPGSSGADLPQLQDNAPRAVP